MLPLPSEDLKLENLLDSEDNMKVSLSSFSRRVALHDASGESHGASSHARLTTKSDPSQTFCGFAEWGAAVGLLGAPRKH